jgi:hypothetical protein
MIVTFSLTALRNPELRMALHFRVSFTILPQSAEVSPHWPC